MPVKLLGDLAEASFGLPLWRYMKLSTLLLLLEGKAFFPSVATLRSGDPLEGLLPRDTEAWLMGKLRDLCGDRSADGVDKWLLSRATEWEQKNENFKGADGWFNTPLFADLYVRELAKRRAIWCWFESEIESAGMWSIYGHNGMAVGTTLGALQKALPASFDFQASRILYADRQPGSLDRFSPESKEGDYRIHRPHLIKGSEYKHEHEVRIVTHCAEWEKGAFVDDIDWSELISEIVISPLLPRPEAKAIESALKKHAWKKEWQPLVRRSSLLGDIADHEEFCAAIAERVRPFFGDREEELDLPPLMKEL